METPALFSGITRRLSTMIPTSKAGRVPMVPSAQTFNTGPIAAFGAGGTAGAQLEALGGTGWLFATVTRITQSVAAVEWQLYAGRGEDRVLLPEDHPAMQLWRRPNQFSTSADFRETFEQHIELTGECYWLVARDAQGLGIPMELWALRPDRVRPIISAQNYIDGWVYKIGDEEHVLAPEDIVPLRMPDPRNPYKGLGPLQAVMRDVETEQMATLYQRNFFANNAEPGGVLEFEHALEEEDFDRIVTRWNQQHRGVTNSHRVAVIEMGKYVDRKISQRDMEFQKLRLLERDAILGAFGMPKSVMGISEDVNRANAEAGDVMFSKYVLNPRLRRIKAALNEYIAPMFGENLMFDFIDPTPSDRELALKEAVDGHRAGVLTKDEARSRIGVEELGEEAGGDAIAGLAFPAPEVQASDRLFSAGILTLNEARLLNDLPEIGPEGDTFASATVEPGAELLAGQQEAVGQIAAGVRDHNRRMDALMAAQRRDMPNPDGLIDEDVLDAEESMEQAWAVRLTHEATMLGEYLQAQDKPASVAAGGTGITGKLEPGDHSGYDWNWEQKYIDEVVVELTAAFEAAALAEGGGVTAEMAARYSLEEGAQMLRGVAATTRDGVAELVAQAVENGRGVGALRQAIEENHLFSRSRARMVARTETADALGEGSMQSALEQGRDEKHWRTQGSDVDGGDGEGPCISNEAQGWIGVRSAFSSGQMRVPAHPNCRCVVSYRTRVANVENIYCPTCKSRRLPVGRIVPGLSVYCRGCNTTWEESRGRLSREETNFVRRSNS